MSKPIKFEITVYDKVPSTADVSVDQVNSYLRRTGWVLEWVDDDPSLASDVNHWTKDGHDLALFADEVFGGCVEGIADAEGRRPSVVLADIAMEQA